MEVACPFCGGATVKLPGKALKPHDLKCVRCEARGIYGVISRLPEHRYYWRTKDDPSHEIPPVEDVTND